VNANTNGELMRKKTTGTLIIAQLLTQTSA